jgi:hypothetical protein
VLIHIAGNAHAGNSGDRGIATNAQLNSPTGLALDDKSNLYIADTGNNSIRKVTTDGLITTVAGINFAGFYGDGGPATRAAINQPPARTADAQG